MKKYYLSVFSMYDDRLIKEVELTKKEYLELIGFDKEGQLGSFRVDAYAEIYEE